MNIKAFFVDALGTALDLAIGTPDDVLRHVPPDVLARHLPRPLWARLLTACLGAPKVDAQLVVETIGIANLCEHVPAHMIWGCIAEIGARSLDSNYVAPATPSIVTRTAPLAPPPPEAVASTPKPGSAVAGTTPVNQPLADLITELESDQRPITPTRSRTPTGQRFRQSTGIGRLGASSSQSTTPQASSAQVRRPQAQAQVVPPKPARRGSTDVSDIEAETAVDGDWREALAVEDSQLVDWQTAEETQTSGEGLNGKRRT